MNRAAPLAGAGLLVAALTALALVVPLPDRQPDSVPGAGGSAADDTDLAAAPQVEPAAHRLLVRAAAAPRSTAYDGTQVVAAWSGDAATTHLLHVTHDPASGTSWRIGGADGPGAQPVRSGGAADPSLLDSGAVDLVARHYSLGTAGTATVAGRLADVVEARTGDGLVRARFWVDRETATMLRRELYDDSGRLTRASAFVDLEVRPASSASFPGAAGHQPRERSLDHAQVDVLRGQGWVCPDELPGPLPLVDARRAADGDGRVHLSYADGLTSVSVFHQRGTLDEDRVTGRQGWTRATVAGERVWVLERVPRHVVWSSDGVVTTVVADAPPRTVRRAVERLMALGAAGEDSNALDRLGRGLDRVASWFIP